tara:strand:+ start:107 stop:385 length:279 start_codon:yes stop_codon:yes gene_type:complete
MLDIAGLLILNRLLLDVKPDVTPVVTPPKKVTGKTPTFTTFGTDPIKFLFPIFTPDPKFVVKEPKGRPQCGLGEKAFWDEATNEYRCVPKLL